MLNNISFGQHYPVKSFIHNMDARIKIFLTTIYVMSIFFIDSYFGYTVTVIFLLSMVFISRVPLKTVLKSIKMILFLVVFTMLLNVFLYKGGTPILSWWIFTITDEAISFAIMMALRLVTLVMGTTLITLTTTPMALTDAMERLMKPLKVVKFPVEDVALIMSVALRFIPTLIEETDRIIMAQKARGGSFENGSIMERIKALLPILIPLFVNSFRRADELALALDSRCYSASPNRTKMKQPKFSYRDVVGAVVMLGFFTIILLDKYLWLGVF